MEFGKTLKSLSKHRIPDTLANRVRYGGRSDYLPANVQGMNEGDKRDELLTCARDE